MLPNLIKAPKRRPERRGEERLVAGKMQEATGRQSKKAKTIEETRTEETIAGKETAAGTTTANNGAERLLHKLFRI